MKADLLRVLGLWRSRTGWLLAGAGITILSALVGAALLALAGHAVVLSIWPDAHTLLIDLESRGMLYETRVVWMGEFGRTPRINANNGRDHWARSWSVVVGGGAIRGGQAYGATTPNQFGTRMSSRSISPRSPRRLPARVARRI